MREYAIAAIPADGIGPEVIPAGLEVLQALAARAGDFRLQVEEFDWGSDHYRRARRHDAGGRPRPPEALRRDLSSAPSARRTFPII